MKYYEQLAILLIFFMVNIYMSMCICTYMCLFMFLFCTTAWRKDSHFEEEMKIFDIPATFQLNCMNIHATYCTHAQILVCIFIYIYIYLYIYGHIFTIYTCLQIYIYIFLLNLNCKKFKLLTKKCLEERRLIFFPFIPHFLLQKLNTLKFFKYILNLLYIHLLTSPI